MKIEKNRVVRFHYTVSEAGQGQIESSRQIEPLSVLIGHGNIIAGLESAMKGREAGETFEVTIGPDSGQNLGVSAKGNFKLRNIRSRGVYQFAASQVHQAIGFDSFEMEGTMQFDFSEVSGGLVGVQ